MRKQSSSDGTRSRTSSEIPRPPAEQTTPTRPSRPQRDSTPVKQAPKQPYADVFEEDDNLRTPRPPDIIAPPPLAPPTITTTLPSPALANDPTLPSPADGGGSRNRPQRRASFHPPPLDTAFSREVLLTSRTGALPGAAHLTLDDGQEGQESIMDSVEDMLESFDWTLTTGAMEGARKKGSADAIETRLLDELSALDSVSLPPLTLVLGMS